MVPSGVPLRFALRFPNFRSFFRVPLLVPSGVPFKVPLRVL